MAPKRWVRIRAVCPVSELNRRRARHRAGFPPLDLLIRTVPFIAKEKCFALKGGTTINLFIRDLPRLSVDIDLTYVPVSPRAKSLAAIDRAMTRIAERIRKGINGAHVHETRHEGAVTKLVVREAGLHGSCRGQRRRSAGVPNRPS